MRTQNLGVEAVSWTGNPLTTTMNAGRTCYKSEKPCSECLGSLGDDCSECREMANEFIRMLMKRGHESVLEHASITFRIIGDRGVTHEDVRHRLCSFSQESTRYCNYSKGRFDNEITVIRPPGLTDSQWERRRAVLECVEKLYLDETAEKVPAQIARGILPISTKAEIVHTANFREWRHILKLRTGKPAHPQIRLIMYWVWEIFSMKWPVIVEDIEPHTKDLEIPSDISIRSVHGKPMTIQRPQVQDGPETQNSNPQ